MSFIECKNCLTGYEITLQKCPVCHMSNVTSEDAVVLLDESSRTEISRLGGVIMEFIAFQGRDVVIIPCEWGVVGYSKLSGIIWSVFVGLVHAVSVNENKIHINLSDKVLVLDGLTGKVMRGND
jgi:RNA polymerase subunit RPABC4/transcription elongation factor Spt4